MQMRQLETLDVRLCLKVMNKVLRNWLTAQHMVSNTNKVGTDKKMEDE